MNAPTTVGQKPKYRVAIRERLRVAWHNWKARKVLRAVKVLSKALQDDPGFAQAWHANICMPIYNATRPMCYCDYHDRDHHPSCQIHQAETIPRRFECREMSIEQANYIAGIVMRHLFGVKSHDAP